MANIFNCKISNIEILADAVYSITIDSSELAVQSMPGQFLHIKCGHSRILRRPISICDVQGDEINIVFEAKGAGTQWLAKRIAGQELDILAPLGNGYKIPDGKLIVVGGGVGTPPLLFTARTAAQKFGIDTNTAKEKSVTAILGFRSADRVILEEDFKKHCAKVIVTTDDGSYGIHGAVTKPLEELLKTGEYTAVMSCGQLLMQKAVAEMCKKYNVLCQVSLEERMGCGIGACLVCACETYIVNEQGSNNGETQMSRACIDGPVFIADEVVWQGEMK